MGAGGIAGELRDHSEHVDRIIRSNFNAANGQTTSISASSHSYSNQQTSTNNFNSTGEALEEMACFSCSSNFSLFRRKNLCQNCKRHYCNDCFAKETKFVPGESVRNCLTCRALQYPIAYKDHLRKLKVRDLREYLRARQISTNQCKEKRDLIELILRHAGDGSHTGNSTSNPHHQARRQTPADPPLSNSQRPEQQRSSNVFPSSNSQPVQVPPSVHMPVSVCKSLSQIQNIEEVEELSVKELKQILKANFVDFKGCCEKKELLDRVRALWKSKQPTKGKDSVAEDKEDDTPDDLCKICMDASIDCVLLECGHMVTCTKCGKQLADCPICRQNIARIVHVFKA